MRGIQRALLENSILMSFLRAYFKINKIVRSNCLVIFSKINGVQEFNARQEDISITGCQPGAYKRNVPKKDGRQCFWKF
jgi:hypothetical protein